MLMVYDISQSLEESNRGIGIKQPSLKLPPIAAVQIFRYKYSTIVKMSKIMCKYANDVMRLMRSVINNQIKVGRMTQYFLLVFFGIGITHNDGDP